MAKKIISKGWDWLIVAIYVQKFHPSKLNCAVYAFFKKYVHVPQMSMDFENLGLK